MVGCGDYLDALGWRWLGCFVFTEGETLMDIGKFLLFGAAAYVGYQYFYKPSTVVTPPAGGIQPAAQLPTPTTNPLTTQSLILAAAAKNNFTMGNFDDWGYYYQQARGVRAPSPDTLGFTEADQGKQLTFAEWWGTASAHGLSGYRRAS
jgi:hypothetical protein